MRIGLWAAGAMAFALAMALPLGAAAQAAEPAAFERGCARLSLEYAYLWDQGDAAGVAALFTADGLLTLGGRALTGPEAITARVAATAERVTIRHLVSNVLVSVRDETTAETVSYAQVFAAPKGETPPVHPGAGTIGEYRDVCVATPEGFRLKTREFRAVFPTPPRPAPAN